MAQRCAPARAPAAWGEGNWHGRWILSIEAMSRTTKPAGMPISRFLSTRSDAAGRIAEKTLSIIDSVHGSQGLPRIRVDSEGTLYRPAGYTRTQSDRKSTRLNSSHL